jgi:hypothetical protein
MYYRWVITSNGFSFFAKVPGGSMTWVVGLTNNSYKSITNTAPGFVNYKKGCTRLAAASDKVYQLLACGRWFSPNTLASSTTKTGRHDIAAILLKVALNTRNHIKSNLSLIKVLIIPKGKPEAVIRKT